MEKKDNLTLNQVLEHYSKLDAPYSENKLKEVNQLKTYFGKKIIESNKTLNQALPIIDITKLIIVEYQKVFGWIEEGFYRFIFKGSRGSAKTTFAIQFIILDMLLDNQASWISIMENKVQHSDTTMLEFKEWIDKIDILWSGFANKWEKSDGQSIKEWRFRHNGNYQKVKFIGLDEASRGTINPPSKNYWAGFHIEEVVSSDEQFGFDKEKKMEKFKSLETLRGSASRFFNKISKEKQDKRFLEIWTFNPYNEEEPALDNFNKFHPDNELELKKYGFTYNTNKDLGEVYITSNYLVNPYLPPEFIRYIDGVIKRGGADERTIAWGMNGSPINVLYQNIFHILDKTQLQKVNYNEKGYTGFKNFMICIDVGNGGEGQMTIGLMGKNLHNKWISLAEWGSGEWEKANGFDSEKIAIQLWRVIKEWNTHYVDFRSMGFIPIVMDYDPHFKATFQRAFSYVEAQWKTQFRLNLFKEKYLTAWKNEKRPRIIRYLISTGMLEIYKKYTPIYYSQLKSAKRGKNGKIIDGNDDYRQAFELGAFHIAREIGLKEIESKKLFDKDMVEFINGI